MYKNIKYLIEDLQRFDISEYDDSNDIVGDQDIVDISYDCPKTKNELIELLISRISKCDFTEPVVEPDMTGIDLRYLDELFKLFTRVFNRISDMTDGVLVNLDLTSWNVSNITNLSNMFYECYEINSINLSGWNVSNVRDMSGMFNCCTSLRELDLSGWNTSNVTNMTAMFNKCHLLKKLDLSNWDTSNVFDMTDMFRSCKSLKFLDISNFNGYKLIVNDNIIYSMFEGLNVKEIKMSKDFFNKIYGYKTDSIKII